MRTRLLAAAAALLIAGAPVLAGDARPMADDPVSEARMLSISEELRCLVCQNESLAGSRADLAQDLGVFGAPDQAKVVDAKRDGRTEGLPAANARVARYRRTSGASSGHAGHTHSASSA